MPKVTDENYMQPRSKLYRNCVYYPKLVLSYIFFIAFGFVRLPTEEFNIRDFWADYEPIQDTSKPAPIIVSNHTSYFDMWLYLLVNESPAFLAKHTIIKMPVVSMMAKLHQVLFIKRGDEKQRKITLDLIEERVKLAMQGQINPIIIFPEGTTTNGRGMMKFKKGAFEFEKPIKVYSLYYSGRFLPCLDLTKPAPSLFIVMCLFINEVKYMRFKEPIDPHYILKKHGRKPGQEGNWQIVSDEIKELMCFAFGLINDKSSFREKCEFDCEVQGITKEQLFKRV